MQTTLFDRTWSVSELGEEVKLFLGEAFADLWIRGEVQRLRRSRAGHLYFELVEKGRGDEIVGKVEAVAWRTAATRIERELGASSQELNDGVEIRCHGRIDFWPPGGRIQLAVDEVDPLFSLGLLARRRQETLAALTSRGLLDRNASRSMVDVPLRIGLVTSHGSAAYHDFVATLGESGLGFRVMFVHAAVQGPSAEREVVSALGAAARAGVDVVAVVRGGGSKTDLAAFDALAVAEAIATCPVPVLTGLGHEIDEAVADLVAHTSVKTPTMAADSLVRKVESAERRIGELADALRRNAERLVTVRRERLTRARRRVAGVGRSVDRARHRMIGAGQGLGRVAKHALRRSRRELRELPRRLAEASARRERTAAREVEQLGKAVVATSRGRLRLAEATLEATARLCQELSPRRTLERGFSVTRGPDGRAIRDHTELVLGMVLRTELARGDVVSRVEKTGGTPTDDTGETR